jgi:superfamily II DNA or RNA helicase
MKPRKPKSRPSAFVNLHGRPIDLADLSARIRGKAGAGTATEAAAPAPKPPAAVSAAEAERVFDALALAGCSRGKTWLTNFLRHLEWRSDRGVFFGSDEVQAALQRLAAEGRVATSAGAGWDLAPADRVEPLARLLRGPDAGRAWQAWARASSTYGHVQPGSDPPRPELRSRDEQVAYARLVLYGGVDEARLAALCRPNWGLAIDGQVLGPALCSPLLPERLQAMPAAVRNALFDLLLPAWPPAAPLWRLLNPLLQDWALRTPAEVEPALRLVVADRMIHRGELAAVQPLLEGLHDDPRAPLLQAAQLARQGRWREAGEGFAQTIKALARLGKAKRGLVPYRTAQWYLWSLLAQPDPAAWTAAKKFALAESGSRTPPPQGWGLFVHAAAVRLGDERLLPQAFDAPQGPYHQWHADEDANTPILAAWLGHQPKGWTGALLMRLVGELHATDRPWKADLLRQAAARLDIKLPPRGADQGEPWGSAWFSAPVEAWRDALAAIQALGSPAGGARAETGGAPLLRWRLALDRHGRVRSVTAFETPMGVRGPGKPREVTLAALKRNTRLAPHDAALLRAAVTPGWGGKPVLDPVAAAQALVGHPQLELAGAPGRRIELVEAMPLLDVLRQRAADGQEAFAFHLADPLLPPADDGLADDELDDDDDDDEDFDALQALRLDRSAAARERHDNLRIVPDGPDRARLLRITPAQRRVAELVSQGWTVPASAQAELDAALRVLAGHFQLHSDAAGGHEVPCDARLRARLSPVGEALQLRLLARPFGEHGPEVLPGRGRERLLTVHEGRSLSTRRALADEAAHLQAVREALPFLDPDDDCTWLLDDPEQALAAVERLPQLGAVAAVEWPRGQRLRVSTPPPRALQIQVGSGRDWFALDGALRLDEARVIGLQRLLELAAQSGRGRFVALGDGEYLALTEQLRRQLADLNALAEAARGGELRLPAVAAAWLAEALADADVEVQGDRGWRERLATLDEAAALQPALPPGLQAELRPYQMDGYVWMARLAHAGLGACLADDMGLGKTVQTLALLLQRAALGPALVLAPTSVCANWVAEARRFAPGLSVTLYGEADREQALQSPGAGQVIVASYTLAQMDHERFAAVAWATLVLDEAQALKNAATQRAKSVTRLAAGFRLGLSGTPVENRLADLWSLMNILVPGLLGSQARFGERFANPIERERDDAARQRLRRLVAPFLLRRTKAQVLADLPPRTEIVHRVEPGPDERAFLEAARRQAGARVAEAGAQGTPGQAAFHVLAELTRLRRAACDPRLAAPELGLAGAKLQAFEQLAAELVAGRHKALVFSQFTDFLKLLAQALQAAGISHQVLDGSTPAAQRAARVAAFQRGEGDLFLISLKAGGFGLNLTAADYVIIVDPWWNPAAEDQAMGRAHRIGQQRPVTVYRLVTAGSIEERIVALHHDKRSLADGILAGQDDAAAIGADELRALLDEV